MLKQKTKLSPVMTLTRKSPPLAGDLAGMLKLKEKPKLAMTLLRKDLPLTDNHAG
jgi:hypothetical protein